ncbi:MAG TPA: cation:proton antiporter [Gemmatimonadales bacterium]|nr:cation:proton antiporter [Gemmatimonadales bacterium]
MPFLAATIAEGGVDIAQFFLIVAAILVAAKFLGELAERIGQPAVLGELLAGVVLGGSVLGVVPAEGIPADLVHVLAELGVMLLLFEIGLETDLREMFRVGPASLAVAVVGVLVPFGLGFAFWAYAPHPASGAADVTTAAIFVGATLTATSVGITARVLSDLGRMATTEARIIIGAAVIDDVLGLVILSVVSGVAAGAGVSVLGAVGTLGVAVGFLVVAVLLGRFIAPRLFDVIVRMRVRFVLLVSAIAFALGLSALASLAGSALIIGSFAAGLILSGTNQFDTIEHEVRPVASIFTPIFFVSVGASVNLRLLDPSLPASRGTLLVAGALVVIAIVGKLAAGWAAPWVRMRRLVVGVGMIPRGEVGLIFADIGRRSGVLSEEVFGAVLLMVMVTTFVAPPALKALFGEAPDVAV